MSRPRPVADVPPAALADGEAAAKAWLLELVAARPLQDAPALPIADLTRDAPPLCAAVLRAVGSDAELPRLEPGGDLAGLAAQAGTLAGAGSAATAVAAVGHLRAALWHTLSTALAPLDAPTTAALAERLAFVCDLVAVATAAASERGPRRGPAGRSEPPEAAPGRGDPAPSERAEAAGRGGAEPEPFRVVDVRGPADSPDADWRAAAAAHLAADRAFALLAVELDDAARLLAADVDGSAAGVLATAEAALRAELRPGDVMQREPDGRLWVVAADLGASGGRSLAERLADAAGTTALHGVPLRASIGLAASPADGAGVGELEARADEALFAARAAGVPFS